MDPPCRTTYWDSEEPLNVRSNRVRPCLLEVEVHRAGVETSTLRAHVHNDLGAAIHLPGVITPHNAHISPQRVRVCLSRWAGAAGAAKIYFGIRAHVVEYKGAPCVQKNNTYKSMPHYCF
jgi:glycine/D-amino acid oxidase-like deaminating enzyme